MSAEVRTGRTGDDPAGDVVFLERLTAELDRYADRPRIAPAPPAPVADVSAPDDVEPARTFDAIVDGLRAESAWSQPPASLRALILNRVREEAAADALAADPRPAGPDPVVGPVMDAAPERSTPGRLARWRPRWQRLAWAVPAAGLAAAIFTAGVLVAERALAPADPPGTSFTATGTALAVGATATVTISASGSGFVVVVAATGLPAAAPGSYYAAWLHGPRGVVPLGSFHEHQAGGPVRLWSGVDPAEYRTFVVTLQAEGDPPTPSNLVVMTATLHS
jgi:hypothetical protein